MDFQRLFSSYSSLVVVEQRKELSRQRWQRTKDEVDEQKRLLKIRLEKRIQRVSENLKKPTFIKMRDKIAFTIGVANTCFSPLIGMKLITLILFFYNILNII